MVIMIIHIFMIIVMIFPLLLLLSMILQEENLEDILQEVLGNQQMDIIIVEHPILFFLI